MPSNAAWCMRIRWEIYLARPPWQTSSCLKRWRLASLQPKRLRAAARLLVHTVRRDSLRQERSHSRPVLFFACRSRCDPTGTPRPSDADGMRRTRDQSTSRGTPSLVKVGSAQSQPIHLAAALLLAPTESPCPLAAVTACNNALMFPRSRHHASCR